MVGAFASSYLGTCSIRLRLELNIKGQSMSLPNHFLIKKYRYFLGLEKLSYKESILNIFNNEN